MYVSKELSPINLEKENKLLKPRELINQKTDATRTKIKDLKLYKYKNNERGQVKTNPVNKQGRWLESKTARKKVKILTNSVRSLVEINRRMVFATAVMNKGFDLIYQNQTWLTPENTDNTLWYFTEFCNTATRPANYKPQNWARKRFTWTNKLSERITQNSEAEALATAINCEKAKVLICFIYMLPACSP